MAWHRAAAELTFLRAAAVVAPGSSWLAAWSWVVVVFDQEQDPADSELPVKALQLLAIVLGSCQAALLEPPLGLAPSAWMAALVRACAAAAAVGGSSEGHSCLPGSSAEPAPSFRYDGPSLPQQGVAVAAVAAEGLGVAGGEGTAVDVEEMLEAQACPATLVLEAGHFGAHR